MGGFRISRHDMPLHDIPLHHTQHYLFDWIMHHHHLFLLFMIHALIIIHSWFIHHSIIMHRSSCIDHHAYQYDSFNHWSFDHHSFNHQSFMIMHWYAMIWLYHNQYQYDAMILPPIPYLYTPYICPLYIPPIPIPSAICLLLPSAPFPPPIWLLPFHTQTTCDALRWYTPYMPPIYPPIPTCECAHRNARFDFIDSIMHSFARLHSNMNHWSMRYFDW